MILVYCFRVALFYVILGGFVEVFKNGNNEGFAYIVGGVIFMLLFSNGKKKRFIKRR